MSAANAFFTMLVLGCWPVYLLLFYRPRQHDPAAKRNLTSRLGIALQFGSVLLIWIARRPLFAPSTMIDAIAATVALCSVWGSYHSLLALGAQWSFTARVRTDHVLVQSGPYGFIRHPLYVCFFGLTAATAAVWSLPSVVPVALLLFILGVWVRVRTEERMLREALGDRFEDYARRVPAFVPRLQR